MTGFFDKLFGKRKTVRAVATQDAELGRDAPDDAGASKDEHPGHTVPDWVVETIRVSPPEMPPYSPEQRARFVARQRMFAQALQEQLEKETAGAEGDRVAAALRLGHVGALLAAVERSIEESPDPDVPLAALVDAATRFVEYERWDIAAVQYCSAIRLSPLSYRPWWGMADILRSADRPDAAGICHLNAARCALCWALHKRRSPGEKPDVPQLMGLMLVHSAINYRRAESNEPIAEQAAGGIAAIEHLRSAQDGEWRKALSDINLPLDMRGMHGAGLTVQVKVQGAPGSFIAALPAVLESELDRLVPFSDAILMSDLGPRLDERELGFTRESFCLLDQMFPESS